MTSAPSSGDAISLGSRLMTLTNLMRRTTALRFRRLFELSLVDGWIISHLGAGGAMSLDTLAFRSGLAKSQISRGVTSMVQRKLVDRQRNAANLVEVALTLTPEGQKIFRDIKRRWPSYNKLLLEGLSGEEGALLSAIIERMTLNSRRNLEHEQSAGGVLQE